MPVLNYRGIQNRMRSHQHRMFVNSSVWTRGWYQGPYTQFANRPHGDVATARDGWTGSPYNYGTIWWKSLLSWFTAYPAAVDGSPGTIWHTATNTRIHVRNIRTILNKTTGARTLVNSLRDVPADKFTVTFDANNTSDPGGRTESAGNGNGRSYLVDTSGNYAVHGYGNFVTVDDPENIEDITVDMEFKLILDNPSGTDDRANAKIVVVIGCDAYPYAGAPMSSSGYWPAIGASGAMLATNDWQSVTFTTLFTGVTTHMSASQLASTFTDTLFVAEGVAGRLPGYTDGGSVPGDGTGGGGTQPDPDTSTMRVGLWGGNQTAGDEGDFDGPNSYRSYRGELQQLMSGAGYTIDYIGARSNVPAVGGDPDHDGYSGALISTTSNNWAARRTAVISGAGTLGAAVFYIGWDDVVGAPDGIADRYTAEIEAIRAAAPSLPLVLCTLTPRQGETEAQTNAALPAYAALNTRIRATPATVSNTRVADCATAALVSGDYWNSTLWLQSGADKVAAIIAPQLQAALGPAGGTTAPEPGTAFVIPNRPRVLTVSARTTGGNITVAGSGTTPAAPAINTATITGGQVGQFYTVTLSVTGTPAPTVSVTTGTLPAGLSLTGSTISGTPTTAGSTTFTVSATNGSGTATRTYTLVISTATSITTTTLANVATGAAFALPLAATGAAPITWTITERGTLPTTVQMIGNTLSGTIASAAAHTFTVTASGPGGTDSQELTLTAVAAGDFPVITTTALASGTVGVSYSQTITATGAAPITFGASGLPAGLALNASTGAITGTPTAAGLYIVTISASNSNPPAAAVSFPLRIEAVAAVDVASPWARFTRP